MSPGDKIKQLRKRRKMTQEELGKLLGVNKSAVQKYEKGDVVNLKLNTIQKLCEIFDVNPIEFIFPNATRFDLEYKSDALSQEVKVLEKCEELYGYPTIETMSLFNTLNDRGKTKVLDIMHDLILLDKYRKM